MTDTFCFKEFSVRHGNVGQKVTTDSVLLGAWIRSGSADVRNILDVGAGMGLLSLLMAQRFPVANIRGVEIEHDAVSECRYNFVQSPWSGRLEIEEADFRTWESLQKFDIILCNPPYFPADVSCQTTRRTLARHETWLNIDNLIKKGCGLLNANGVIGLVCKSADRDRVMLAASLAKLDSIVECRVVTVEGKSPELSMFRLKHDGESGCETLTLRKNNGMYTEDYINLTMPYYLFLH